MQRDWCRTVRPDQAIYWTLGNFSKPWQQLICTNLLHSQAIFVKVSKFSEIIFGQLLQTFGNFLLVTLLQRLVSHTFFFLCFLMRHFLRSFVQSPDLRPGEASKQAYISNSLANIFSEICQENIFDSLYFYASSTAVGREC